MSVFRMGTCRVMCAACPTRSARGCLRIRPTGRQAPPRQHRRMEHEREKDVELEDAVTYALDEARMVLPGIQALFGFQLVAVFNERFSEIFDAWGQWLHLAALVFVALACALAMTPAAFHRQNDHGKV